MATFGEIIAGLNETQLFSALLARLKGKGLPTIAWGSQDPQQVTLEHGFAPLLATVYGYASSIASGRVLRLAVRMAELDPDTWENDPDSTFLQWLARDLYAVEPLPPAFTVGTMRLINTTGAALVVPLGAAFATPSNLLYRLAEAAPVTVPANNAAAPVYALAQAEKTGENYNVPAGAINRLVTSLAGLQVSNQPAPPAADWIITYGGRRERPGQVEARCRAWWGRLAVLQTAPADAYRAAALDARLTGVDAVRKVAVWSHYDADTGLPAANTATLYLAGDAGPVTAQQATAVQAAMLPYIGLHDRLKVRPCGSASYAPAGTVKVRSLTDVAAVASALARQAQRLQQRLQIGQVVRAWDVRDAVGDQQAEAALTAVVDFVETLADFQPAKNALVAVSFAALVVEAV